LHAGILPEFHKWRGEQTWLGLKAPSYVYINILAGEIRQHKRAGQMQPVVGKRGKLANCLALLVWLTVSAQFALAHDTWISRKQYRNPWSGAWCCDDHDCSPIDDREIVRTGHGFLVVGTYLVS
jgi:hypothetical protein